MKTENKRQTRRYYDSDFKSNALALIASGRSVQSVAAGLGVAPNLLYAWRSKARKQAEANGSDTSADATEIKQLRKRLEEVEEERDILKKALSIFSRRT